MAEPSPKRVRLSAPSAKDEVSRMKTKITATDSIITVTENKITMTENKITVTENKIAVTENKIAEEPEKLKEQKEELEELERKLEKLERKLEKLKEELEKLKEELKGLKEELKNYMKQCGIWVSIDGGDPDVKYDLDYIGDVAVFLARNCNVSNLSKCVTILDDKKLALDSPLMDLLDETTVTRYLCVLSRISVKVQLWSQRDQMELKIAVRSSMKELLTQVAKNVGWKASRDDLIISHSEHGDITDTERLVYDFPLEKPFHIRGKQLCDSNKVELLRSVIQTPSIFANVGSIRGISNSDKQHGISSCLGFNDINIFDHRGEPHRGNHVSLYYVPFNEFVESCNTTSVDKEDCQFANDLCIAMGRLYKCEADRVEAIKSLLFHYLQLRVAKFVDPKGSSVECEVGIGLHNSGLMEYKNEVGSTGQDSFKQGLGYYIFSLSDFKFQKCSVPRYILELIGPHLIISGAVFGEGIYVDRLVPPLWLTWQPNDRAAMIQVAKTMKSLKLFLHHLEDGYTVGEMFTAQPRFPSFLQDRIRYVKQLSPHVFQAKYDNKPAVVKFSESYCCEIHRFMYTKGYAPQLYLFQTFGRFKAVVMEDLTETALQLDEYLQNSPSTKKDVAQHCSAALKVMHDNGFCHGDFRSVNIMVNTNTQAVAIIDFDWAGKEGEATYPYFMNHVLIEWPPDAVDGELITKEHDKYWLNKLTICSP